MLLNAHTISWNIWQLSCAHRNSRNILRGPVQISWVCLKHQTKSIIPRLSKSNSQVLGTLRTRTMPQVCQSILHWPFSIRHVWRCLTRNVDTWQDGTRMDTDSSPPGASGLCAANALQQRPWPSAWPVAAWLESLRRSKRSKGIKRPQGAKDVQNATAIRSLLPYRSVHRCGGPTWPYASCALNDSKISILDEQAEQDNL